MGKDVQTETSIKFYRYCVIAITVILLVLQHPETVRAEPVSATAFFISLAISAASTAAQFAVSYLLAPKQKPVDKDKLSGDVKITGIGEDMPIPEIYGKRGIDGLGGYEYGGVIVYASAIRKTVVQIPGGGGGKGGPRAAPQNEYHYFQDYAVLAARGPQTFLQIRANTDIIYNAAGGGLIIPDGLSYEAEDADVIDGDWTVAADASCSSGYKVINTTDAGYLLFNHIVGVADSTNELYVFYQCPSLSGPARKAKFTINGTVYPLKTFPMLATTSTIGSIHFPITLAESGTNTIKIESDDITDSVSFDRLIVDYTIVERPARPENPGIGDMLMANTTPMQDDWLEVSGVFNEHYTNPTATYDNLSLTDPQEQDVRPFEEWDFQPVADADGMIELYTASMDALRLYSGTSTQTADPLLQTYFNTLYSGQTGGNSAAPAYRYRAYFVVENMEITKYSGIPPNFIIRSEHQTAGTLKEMFETRAGYAGIDSSEYDFSGLSGVAIRGVGIMQNQPPISDMQKMCRIFDVDIYSDVDGKVKGIVPSDTVAWNIPISELEVKENYDPSKPSTELPNPVETTIRDEYQLPKIFTVGFFDVSKNFEPATVNAQREYTVSDRHETYGTEISMTQTEAQRFADRELQKLYAEKNAMTISTFPKHAQIVPTDLITVEEVDGTLSRMRVKGVDGWLPGALTITGVSRNLPAPTTPVQAGREEGVDPSPSRAGVAPTIPGYVIGTIIDVGILRTTEHGSGFYVAACLTNQDFKWQGCVLMVERASGYEKLTELPKQAIMGRTVIGTDGELPVVDDSQKGDGVPVIEPASGVTVTVDLYCGEIESRTTDEVEDRANTCVIGNEICLFETATRDNDYPNRWVLSNVYRKGNGSTDIHTDGERFVLLNSAVKWVPIDISEVDKTRNYKFVGSGQVIDNVWSTEVTYLGNAIETSELKIRVFDDYVVRMKDGTINVDATGQETYIYLPPVDMANYHDPFTIKKIDGSANYVFILPDPADINCLIDNSTSHLLAVEHEYATLYVEGNSWWKR